MADVIRMHGIKVDKDGKFVFPTKQAFPLQIAVERALQSAHRSIVLAPPGKSPAIPNRPAFGKGKIENVKPNA